MTENTILLTGQEREDYIATHFTQETVVSESPVIEENMSALEKALSVRFDDKDEIRDIVNNELAGGFSGFIYTQEINEFFSLFEDEIEDYYYEVYGVGWLKDIVSDCDDMNMLRCRLVYGVVEMWCADKWDELMEVAEEAVA